MNNLVRDNERFFYAGPSMRSVFNTGDELEIQKIGIENVSRGDVVVFIKRNNYVVHRVIKILPERLVTRGDNNTKTDPEPVTGNDLIGKVSSFRRNSKIIKVKGGISGLILSRGNFIIKRSVYIFYKFLTKFSPVRYIGKAILKSASKEIKIIEINTEKGVVTKWVLRENVIARKGPGKEDFYVRKPYDLIIKDSKTESGNH